MFIIKIIKFEIMTMITNDSPNNRDNRFYFLKNKTKLITL